MGQNLFPEGASPSTPASGYVAVYAKTDSNLYIKDDAGLENLVGANVSVADPLYSIAASVATNALTLTLNPCIIKFRSTTLTDGTPTTVSIGSAITLTVPDTATLGTTNAVAARLVLVALNNAGVGELAIVNMSGGVNLDESGVLSTTAMSTASDSATVVYSASARTSVAYKVVGFLDITEATAGSWATAPSTVQGAGGNALTTMGSLGYGQTWQNVTRTSGTTYYNTTGKPILLTTSNAAGGSPFYISVNGVTAGYGQAGPSNIGCIQAIIPPYASYVLFSAVQTVTAELR